MGMISPNQLQAEACKAYGFAAPKTRKDWQLCVNFWAANIQHGLEVSCCQVVAMLFDCPLTRQEIEAIATFQSNKKVDGPPQGLSTVKAKHVIKRDD